MDMNAIDARMASLMNLRQEWIDKGFPADSRNELKKELKSFPAELEIHKKFVEDIEYAVDQGEVPLVAERGPQMLPVRNRCTDIPGHVTCFKEHNGLIHGGIIKAPTYTLTCRAFRLGYIKRYEEKRPFIRKIRKERTEAVVAGVCEQRNQSNKIINPPWSTASKMPLKYIDKSYYSSVSISLPTPAIRNVLNEKRVGWKRAWFGYYFPNGWSVKNTSDMPDTGQPTYAWWKNLKGKYMWDYHPSHASCIESAFYNNPEKCSEGFVICTPYIKIFHPDPNMKETVVWMIGAYRHQKRGKNKVEYYNRSAQWYCKTFR